MTIASSQKQSAADGSTAIQATGDVHVNNGVTIAQMSEILGALSSHVDKLGAIARTEIDVRLKAFEQGVMERFATDQTTRSEAFREPDFLAATSDAQKAYARSGDDGLRGVLIDLVAQRSKIEVRSRLSLTLNDAIVKVGLIPGRDLNMLSLIFLFKYVQHNGITNIQSLAWFLMSAAAPLVSDISTSDSAVSYLAAHGCVIPPSGISSHGSALDILRERYRSVVTKGVTEEALRGKFPDYYHLVAKGIIVDSPYENGLPYKNGLKTFLHSGPQLDTILSQVGIYGNYSSRYSEVTLGAEPSDEELLQVVAFHLPEIGKIVEQFDRPNIRNSRLTSVGIALAHANLSKVALGDADLSIWIEP